MTGSATAIHFAAQRKSGLAAKPKWGIGSVTNLASQFFDCFTTDQLDCNQLKSLDIMGPNNDQPCRIPNFYPRTKTEHLRSTSSVGWF